ncbi:MAG: endonuclease III [Synergistaceae bacterium]|jgi:endonuclease-3|nr:endonuclease III [Synergistaceae bacterium]
MLPPGKKTAGTIEAALEAPARKKLSGSRKNLTRRIALTRWIAEVLDRLEACWHNEASPPALQHSEPLDGLILTVLSQHTNDRNRDAAFSRLKERYPTWEEAVLAGYGAVEEAVRPAGLAPTKAGRILEILKIVRGDFGRYSILPLADRGRDAAREYLLSLPGVGEKTAACVLLFDMRLPAFPVDTHIARFCQRVGFVPGKTPAEEICRLMEREVAPDRYLGGHVNIIEHGRNICKARAPLCEKCAAAGLCMDMGCRGPRPLPGSGAEPLR